MRSKRVLKGLACLAVMGGVACTAMAQQGVVERAGQKIDDVGRGIKRGAIEIGEALRNRFEIVRTDVHRMGTQPRVYARLHWDRALHGSRIEVHMLRDGSVLLRGVVPNEEARKRAVAIAAETVDVTGVVDELTSLSPAPATTTTTTTSPTVKAVPRTP